MPELVQQSRKRQRSVKPGSVHPYAIPPSLSLQMVSHPLGVRPAGNLFLAGDKAAEQLHRSMGDFAAFPEELIMQIVEELDSVRDLISLMKSSRFFYAFTSFDELWKQMYLKGQTFDRWRGSWKTSILRTSQTLVDCSIVHSDLLFVPYQNSHVDYHKLFEPIIADETRRQSEVLDAANDIPYTGSIPRVSESSLTPERFASSFHDRPFILKSKNPARWPNWTLDTLSQRFQDVSFRQECVDWPLRLYTEYCANNLDESPLYLFDCNSEAMQQLKNEFARPAVFSDDMFDVFTRHGLSCRPDHTWLIMGPHRSGSTFHKDPNNTSAWNTVLDGSKLWIMLPPHVTPPGVHTNEDESEVTSPLGLAEWVLSGFFNDTLKIAREEPRCTIGITFPGECIHVPAGWWHMVINLEDSVALTANFVPECKLEEVARFFRDKPDQISGFHAATVLEFVRKCVDAGEMDTEILRQVGEVDSNEDVGESGVELPIYDIFHRLLQLNGRELKQPKNAWKTLTQQATGFKFAMDFE
ncbi:hypothetical protein OGAPHI_002971 [Ogataea philodendri]|uniref:JmjC domain-containing protein n=1 Tax=Ogataea philodendri TaxID=1378263 RepID=A0A9P8P8J1_9ASCO|nr:uncharacterized protein OGAPHI_002971 [Ogataea philodendri]KAH3667322.1 hypothetical protein OGAPHI_002971 [Ogataea philodendri]